MYPKHLFRLIPVIAFIFLTTACGGSDSAAPDATGGDSGPDFTGGKKLTTISQKMTDPEALVPFVSYTYYEDTGLLEGYSVGDEGIRLIYDDADRIIRMEFCNHERVVRRAFTWEYDESGHMTRAVVDAGTIVPEYDDNDRVVKITYVDDQEAPLQIETRTYNAAGKLSGISIANADDPGTPIKTYTYSYTEAGEFYRTVTGTDTYTYEWETEAALKVTHDDDGTESIEVFTFSDSPVAWESGMEGGMILLPRYLMDLFYSTGTFKDDPCGIKRGLYSLAEDGEGYTEFDYDAEAYPVEARIYNNGTEGNPASLAGTLVYGWE